VALVAKEVDYSPRRPPPEIPEWRPILAKPSDMKPVHKDDPSLGPDPWLPGGCGILCAKKVDQSRGLHFDSLWKAQAVRLSPDRTSATFRGHNFGGLVVSSEELTKKSFGRWFEVLIEEANTFRWSDGLGIGVAAVDSRDFALARVKNAERVINGFAYELIPESWLVGYDGRAKLRGMSRYLQVHEIHQGMWRPSELKSGDILGLLVTTDGNLLLFVNEELRYFVTCGDVPWKKPLCAVVDLDGCTQSVHLLDSDGTPPEKVLQSWQAAVAASRAPVSKS